MKRLFLSLYSALIATIIFFVFSAHFVNTYLLIDVDNIIEAKNFEAEIELLEQLAPYLSTQNINNKLLRIAELNQTIISEINYNQIPNFVQKSLTEQKVWVDDNDLAYFWAFKPKQYFSISENENHELVKVDIIIEYAIICLMLALLAVISFIWMKFLGNKLNYLEQATEKFGEGDFSIRAPISANLAVGNLNVRFNTMASKIESLLSSHKQLSHNIAHELRTPIFKMQMQLELLDSNSTQKQQKYISGIEEDLFNLQDLVDELLQYAQAERAELIINVQNFDLKNVITDVIDGLLPTTNQSITFKYDNAHSTLINADKNLIRRVVKNLIHNAVKYGNSIIEVSVSTSNKNLLIYVDDNGPGINDSQLNKIFDPFYQVDSSHQGYGLGLSLAKQITKLHCGELHYEPSWLGGARFIIKLPLNL
jgi:two-component system sensor histidine kinase RstB